MLWRPKFTEKFIPSLAHRDLSVGNILISDDGKVVKFIDPRSVVPHLGKTPDTRSRGNIVLDLVSYRISLMRKHAELNHLGKNDSLLPLLEEVAVTIKDYMNRGAFTQQMLLLCEA